MRRPRRPSALASRIVAEVRSCESPGDHFIKFVLTPALRKWGARYERITAGTGDEFDPNVIVAQASLYLDQINPTEVLGPRQRCEDQQHDDDAP